MENNNLETRKIQPRETLISWEAPDFIHHERDIKWYLIAGLVALGFLGYSVYSRDWFFIIILVMVVVGVSAYLKTAPKIRHYSISRLGIQIDGEFYAYNALHSFWIIYDEHVRTLNFMQNKKLAPAIIIQLDGQDPLTIRSILKKFLPEEEKRDENYADKISRILKF